MLAIARGSIPRDFSLTQTRRLFSYFFDCGFAASRIEPWLLGVVRVLRGGGWMSSLCTIADERAVMLRLTVVSD